jgi:hypothetical protein
MLCGFHKKVSFRRKPESRVSGEKVFMDALYLVKLTSPSFFDNVLSSQRDGPDRGNLLTRPRSSPHPPGKLRKTAGLFRGVMEIHVLNYEIPLYFKRLGKRKACNNKQNYYIVI